MKLSKLVGWVLILVPFVAITGAVAAEEGLVVALGMMACAASMAGLLVLGIYFVHK